MKTYCQNVDITNPLLISAAVQKCLRHPRKRAKLARALARRSGIPLETCRRQVAAPDSSMMKELVRQLSAELAERRLRLKPIQYNIRTDSSSGKQRRIGRQTLKQCLLDHVAVLALGDVFRRIGEYQMASIPGRGQLAGARRIARWLSDTRIRYAVKLDVQHCFESIEPARVYTWLSRLVKNDGVLYLLRTLLAQHHPGLSIGSYLSQYLCNLYLSRLYHYVSEQLFRLRRGKRGERRIRLIDHTLFYMDDILILGHNRRDMERAAERITTYARDVLHLTIKPGWHIIDLDRPPGYVDMMGYRCHRGFLTIRRRVWRRCRRALIHCDAQLHRLGYVCRSTARRAASYNGYILASASRTIMSRYHVKRVRAACTSTLTTHNHGHTSA